MVTDGLGLWEIVLSHSLLWDQSRVLFGQFLEESFQIAGRNLAVIDGMAFNPTDHEVRTFRVLHNRDKCGRVAWVLTQVSKDTPNITTDQVTTCHRFFRPVTYDMKREPHRAKIPVSSSES